MTSANSQHSVCWHSVQQSHEGLQALQCRLQLRSAHGRHPLKILLQGQPAAPALAQQLQGLLHWHWLALGGPQQEQQIICDLSHAPAGDDWQLAVMLALHALLQPQHFAATGAALGRVPDWQPQPSALCQPEALAAALALLPPELRCHLPTGTVSTSPDAAPRQTSLLAQLYPRPPRSMRVYFPLVGAVAQLGWLEAAQYACDTPQPAPALQCCGQHPAFAAAVCHCLQAARETEAVPVTRWQTLLRFSTPDISGDSWQLAAVLADRISRGRLLPPAQGRLIASGASQQWPQVQTVAACADKCALLLQQAQAHDRILLPHAWQADLPAGFAAALQARRSSLRLLDSL